MKTACLLFGVFVLINAQVDKDNEVDEERQRAIIAREREFAQMEHERVLTEECERCKPLRRESFNLRMSYYGRNETAINLATEGLKAVEDELELMIGKPPKTRGWTTTLQNARKYNRWMDDALLVFNSSRIEPAAARVFRYFHDIMFKVFDTFKITNCTFHYHMFPPYLFTPKPLLAMVQTGMTELIDYSQLLHEIRVYNIQYDYRWKNDTLLENWGCDDGGTINAFAMF